MPLDVATRWNSTLPMLRGAFANRLHMSQYANLHGTQDVKNSLLLDTEWEDVKKLGEFLQPLDNMTKECSAADQPTFHLGKPTLDLLRRHLKSAETDSTKVIL